MKKTLLSFIPIILCVQIFYAQDVSVSGYIRYWNNKTNSYTPLVDAEIQIWTYNPTTTPTPVVYTNQNGYFWADVDGYPDVVTVRLFFRNSKVDLRGATTTRSDSYTVLRMTYFPNCPNPNIPCSYYILGSEFNNIQYNLTGTLADYAKIFSLANTAANFSINNGYTPPQAIIKYPAEESILNGVTVSVNSSFFYPFGTVSTNDLGFLTPIIDFLGHSGEITGQGVYITADEVNANHESTIYHEYGHFLMWAKRGDWPISFQEYTSGVPMNHSWDEQIQNVKTAFVEGWANFFGSAVESWVYNPSSPYSGRFVSDGYVYSNLFESPYSTYLNKPNGYAHEVLIGSCFFDFYDPATGDDAFQTSFQNILNVIGEKQSTIQDFISVFVRKSFLTDAQRNAGIPLLTTLKMDPNVTYGINTMTVKNDFNGGIINIDNGEINTDNTGGVYTDTKLWMSTQKRLQAVEQPYADYQRLFKHTNPSNPSGKTWTTDNEFKNNQTETWNPYFDGLTFTANFDRLCNITVNNQSAEGIAMQGSSTSSRAGSLINLTAPDQTINNITHKFYQWSDGNTQNPRPYNVSAHADFTAQYKAHLGSNLSTVTANNNQQKTGICSYYPVYVYASAGTVWATRMTDYEYEPESRLSNYGTTTVTYKSPSIAPHEIGETYFHLVYQKTEQAGSNYIHSILYKYGGTFQTVAVCTTASANYDATPVVSYGRTKYSTSPADNVYRTIAITYRNTDGIHIAMRRMDETNWTDQLVPGTTSSASNASVALEQTTDQSVYQNGYIVYQQYGQIYFNRIYRKLGYTTIVFDQYAGLSEYYDQYLSNDSPSLVLKLSSYSGGAQAFVSWHAVPEAVMGGVRNVIVTRQRIGTTWQPYKQISHSNHQSSAPSIGYDAAQNKLSLYFQCSSHIGYTSANPSSGSWSWSAVQNMADNASNPIAGSFDYGRMSLWTTGSAPIYNVVPQFIYEGEQYTKGQSGKSITTLSKTSEPAKESVQYKRVALYNLARLTESIPALKGAAGKMILEFKPYVWENTNEEETFTEVDTIITNWFGTKPFTVIPSKEKLYSRIKMSWNNISVKKSGAILKLFSGKLEGGNPLKQFTLNDLLKSGTDSGEVSWDIAYNLAGQSGKKIAVTVEIPEVSYGEIYHTPGEGEALKEERYNKEEQKPAPSSIALFDAYPNPFNPSTNFEYRIANCGLVTLKVYDVLGREVATLVDGMKDAGYYNATFDASQLASGVYFARFTATPQEGKPFVQVQKLLMTK